MAHLIDPLTFTDKIFKPMHELGEWILGDKTAQTYGTRKTFFEGLVSIFGFIAVNSIWKRINLEQYL